MSRTAANISPTAAPMESATPRLRSSWKSISGSAKPPTRVAERVTPSCWAGSDMVLPEAACTVLEGAATAKRPVESKASRRVSTAMRGSCEHLYNVYIHRSGQGLPLGHDDGSRSNRRGRWNDPLAIRPALRTRRALSTHDVDRAVGLHNREPLPFPGTHLKRVSVAETIQDRVLDPRSSSDSEKLDPGTNEQAAHNRSPTGRRGWSNDGSLLGHCWRGWGYDYLDVGCMKGRRHQDSSDGRKTNPAHVNLYAGALGLSASSASDSSSESGKGSVPTARIADYPQLASPLCCFFAEFAMATILAAFLKAPAHDVVASARLKLNLNTVV